MSNIAKKDDVVVLGEREFKRVKNGLDEAQVTSCIDELIEERDKLAQTQDHIASLSRLAEITVVEADKLATQIKTETAEQAKAESTAIIDKAKEQARQITEQKIAEAEEIANEEANAIKAKAEEEAALLLENEQTKIRRELHNLVNQQFGYMLEELESLKRQAAAVQEDFSNKLSEPREEKSDVTVKIAEERDAVAVEIAKESDTTVAEEKDAATVEIAKESDTTVAEEKDAATVEIAKEIDTIVAEGRDAAAVEIANESDIIVAEEKEAAAVEIVKESDTIVAEEKEAAAAEIAKESDTLVAEEKDAAAAEIAKESDTLVAEERDATAVEIAKESDTAVAEERDAIAAEVSKKTLDEYLEPSQAMDHIEKSSELSKLLQIEEQAELGKPQWEVEILPPFDITKIMEVVSYLDQLPEVADTEMIVPQIDMPSILVFLREPINFIDVLQTIPAVAYIEEIATDKAASNGRPRKVRISFSGNTTSPEKK